MLYKNKRRQRFLALFLIMEMLITTLGFATTSYAEEIPQENAITKALDWLNSNQNEDGSWGNNGIAFLDTSEVSGYLTKYGVLADNLQQSTAWMEGLEISNNDLAGRILPFVTSSDKHTSIKDSLLLSQNEDGGWGIARGYESDILDTVYVLNALVNEPDIEPSVMQKAATYIMNRQYSNGSWSFSGEEYPVISLTAQAAITLNLYQMKTNQTSSDLQTVLGKAGEFLISVQKTDKTWGTDQDSIIDTLLSYRAVLNTVGLDVVDTTETSILNAQNTDGSWFGSPYITAIALKAVKERLEMPNAAITSIKLLKTDNGNETECYSYSAYEAFEIQAESTYNNKDTTLLYFVKQKDGSIISAQTDGTPGWNTKNSLPGQYSVIVQIKDNISGKIIASSDKQFVINPSFKVVNVNIVTDPENTRIDKNVTVNTMATIITEANIDKTLSLNLTISDGSTIIATDTKTVDSKSQEQINSVASVSFTPDVTATKDYAIKAEVFDDTGKISEGERTFSVLPPLPPTRIDASQSMDKSVLYPGTDSVTAQLKLSGQGTPETPSRKPIDLVLCIDDSGSMEWGNADYSTTKPWRIDYAKEASKHIIDLLQTQDRAAVVEFAGSIWTQQGLTGDKDLLKTSISITPPSPWNGTSIGGGLQKAISILDNGSSPDRDKVIVLLSDGGDTFWWTGSPTNQAKIAHGKGFKISTIGLGAGADQNLLRSIANIADGNYVFSPTMEQLDEMMNILAGDIFDVAGKNVNLETTLPANGMTVDTTKIVPVPSSVTNNADGSKTLRWSLDSLIMGQEKSFEIKFDGTDLVSDTEIHLTQNTKLTYVDKNNTTVKENLPDLIIPVNKYMLDSKVETNKPVYTANEDVNITNTATNLTNYQSDLVGKVEITDAQGDIVKTLSENVNNTWEPLESKTMNYTWNTGKTMTGTYKAKVTWSEGDKIISVVESNFEIAEDSSVSSSITIDKQRYIADEAVNIIEQVKNNSTNSIEKGLAVKTSVKNDEGTVIWTSDDILPELLPSDQTAVKTVWNTAKNVPGQYTVAAEVYRDFVKLSESAAAFEIVSDAKGFNSVSGSVQVSQKNIYPADPVSFEYTINNTGNVNLNDVTARIRIIDPTAEEVLGTVTEKINIEVSSDYTGNLDWIHEPLETGTYMVVFDAILSTGNVVPLGSGYLNVEKPFETSMNQVVRPRVLVWAESQDNIDLAQRTLDGMQVFYKAVNTREDFMTELRTDKYNLYMMLDSKLPLTGDQDKELATEVAKGKGIIASRDAFGDNLKNLGLFGVKFNGSTTSNDYTVDFSADSVFDQLNLCGTGKALNLELDGGQQLALLNSKKGALPGVVTYKYQKGNSLLFAFDLGSSTGDTESVLKKAVELTASISETSSSYAELEIKVDANTAIGAEIKLNLPEGAEAVWVSPDPDAWKFDTAAGQEYIFRVLIKLSEAAGEYPVIVDSYYSTTKGMLKFDIVEVKVTRVQ